MTEKLSTSIPRLFITCIVLCAFLSGCGCKHEWQEATCDTPKTCSLCQTTDGEAMGHNWTNASYTTPKTCSVCKKTDGSKLSAKEVFETGVCKWLYGTWSGSVFIKGNLQNVLADENFAYTIKLACTLKFNSDGTYQKTFKIENKKELIESVELFYEDLIYEELSSKGYNKTQANNVIEVAYGMSVAEYAKELAAETDWDKLIPANEKGIYFIVDKELYTSSSWTSTPQHSKYHYSNKYLTIDSICKKYPYMFFSKS